MECDIYFNSNAFISINHKEIIKGFFIKTFKFNWLFIPNYRFSYNITIKIYYNNLKDNNTIVLDKERIIKNFNNPIEATLIQILENDNMKKIDYLVPDYNYKHGYEIYQNQKIYSVEERLINNQNKQYFHKINGIDKYDNYQFKFLSDSFSPYSPILLENNNIIGIQFQNKNSFYIGISIGFYLEELNKYLKDKKELGNNREKLKNNENIKNINILDEKIKKDKHLNRDYYKFFEFLNEKNYEFFVEASIFDKSDYIKTKKEFEDKFTDFNNFSELEKSCIGSILGMAIGDAIGARVEFLPLDYDYKEIKDIGDSPAGKFNLEAGQWTDDTSMGLCIADSLIENNGEFDPRDIMMRFILWWNFGYNNAFRFDNKRYRKHSVGLGGNTKGSFKQYIINKGKEPYTKYGDRNTSGNGSIMRNAPIPICYFRDKKKALEYAKNQSLITHQGDEAAGCCQLITFIIYKILKVKEQLLKDKKEIIKKPEYLRNILEDLKDFKCKYNSVNLLAYSKSEGNDRNWNWKEKNFKYSEMRAKKQPGYIGSYCMDGLAMALHKLYTTDSFEKAILEGVNLCGDADSVGSVIGQIAGAFYGLDSIPINWINTINKWDNKEIALRGYILCHLEEKKK